MTNFRLFQTEEFADNNFKLGENGRNFSKRVENTVEKRRNCLSRAISPFPTVFSKDLHCRHAKTRACLRKGEPFPKRQILKSSKLEDFADDNFNPLLHRYSF